MRNFVVAKIIVVFKNKKIVLLLGQFFVIKVIFFLEGLFFMKYPKIQSKLSYDV